RGGSELEAGRCRRRCLPGCPPRRPALRFGGARAPRPACTVRSPANSDDPTRGWEGLAMCRWLAYSGSPIKLEELLVKRDRSLIDQSLHSRMGATTTNGDGFGVGWYENGEPPAALPPHP